METLKLNSTGPEVDKLTEYLVKYGFLQAKTSVFDKTVQNAVKLFQAANVDPRDHPLAVDGEVGPLTLWALEHDDISSHVQPSPVLPVHTADPNNFGSVVLSFALKEMEAGAREIGSDNHGPFVKKYYNGLCEEGNAWCAAFVSFCHKSAADFLGIPMPYNYTLGAKDTFAQFKKKGWDYKASDANPPQPGDIICFTRGLPSAGTGHVGLVHHYANGIVFSVEGNKGPYDAKVRTFTYTLGNIANLWGFGRVKL